MMTFVVTSRLFTLLPDIQTQIHMLYFTKYWKSKVKKCRKKVKISGRIKKFPAANTETEHYFWMPLVLFFYLKVIALLPYPKTGILGDVQGGMLHWNHLSLQYKILITITAA